MERNFLITFSRLGSGEGIILDILLGIAGAFAVVLLILYHAVRRSRTWGG